MKNLNQRTKITEAIILAGGLGTRLRSVVPELPKCMAPVAGHPFLFYVINHLRIQGIQKIIFSLGYRHEAIEDYLKKEYATLDYDICIEDQPLGTGGGIQLALQKALTNDVIVVNGDTLVKFSLEKLSGLHADNNASCTLVLKPMREFNRYGAVETDIKNTITDFKEKQFYSSGLINAGVYLINKKDFFSYHFPESFSFERDCLERFVNKHRFAGSVQDVYFIDIGIPEDFGRAQREFSIEPLDLSKVDKNWTLLLDRDGVINHDKVGSYVFNADEFEFTNGAPSLFRKLTEKFHRIFVVTNQRGVGRGLMTLEDLTGIHSKMNNGIESAGGRIEKVYYTNDTSNTSFMRKPNPGMALQILKDYPDVNLSKTIMVGNNISDMRFARNSGMRSVFIKSTIPDVVLPDAYIDLAFEDLKEFSDAL